MTIMRFIILFIPVFYFINVNAQKSLEFSGYTWYVKDSKNERVGPGYNLFSDDKSMVFIDEYGNLVLNVKQKDKWTCSEVFTEKSFGYGTYIFEIESAPTFLHRNLVIGLFVYDYFLYSSFHNEIDIEFSRWGNIFNRNSQYVLHNSTNNYPIHRFNFRNLSPSTHIFEWHPDSIVFESYSGYYDDIITKKPDERFVMRNTQIPVPNNEKVHINFWITGRSLFLRSNYQLKIRSFRFEELVN